MYSTLRTTFLTIPNTLMFNMTRQMTSLTLISECFPSSADFSDKNNLYLSSTLIALKSQSSLKRDLILYMIVFVNVLCSC